MLHWLLTIVMAISFLNAGAEGSAASGNISLGAPASPTVNDVWIAVIHSSDQAAHSVTDWTQIYQGNGGGTTSRLSVWYFRYAGSTPNLVVTHAAGQSPIGGISAFSGCKTAGSPVNVTGAGGAGTDASIELAGITTTKDGCMILACDGAADDNNRSTLPTGFAACLEDTAGGTQNCYQTTAGGPDGSVALHRLLQASQGPTGDFVDTQAAADAWASVLLALEPAGTTHQGEGIAAGSSSAVGTSVKINRGAGAAVGTSSLVGNAGQILQAAGIANSTSSGVGVAGLVQPIAGILTGASSALGAAGLVRVAQGSALGESSGVAAGVQVGALVGSANGTSAAVGNAEQVRQAAGIANSTSSGVGVAGLVQPIAGILTGVSSALGAAGLVRVAQGSALGESSGVAAAVKVGALAGAANGTSVATGIPRLILALSGIAAGTSSGEGAGQIISGGGTVHQASGIASGNATGIGAPVLVLSAAGTAFGTSSAMGIVSCPCTVQFTNEFFSGVLESWTFTTEIADSSGVLSFVQPDYRVPPVVILVPLDSSMAANRIHVAGVTATDVTISQTLGIGPGRARVLVMRREGLWKRLGS